MCHARVPKALRRCRRRVRRPLPLDERERVLARRDRARGPLLRHPFEQAADLRAGRHAELVAAEQRLGRVAAARLLDEPRSAPAHRRTPAPRAPTARSSRGSGGAGEASRPPGVRPQDRPQPAPLVVGERIALQVPPEDAWRAGSPAKSARSEPVDRAAERLAAGRGRRAAVARRRTAAAAPPECARPRGGRRARPVRARALRSRHPARTRTGRRTGPRGAAAAGRRRMPSATRGVRVPPRGRRARRRGRPPRPPASGTAIALTREVARGEVVADRAPERREVDRPLVVQRDTPGAVPLRERERSPSGAARVGDSCAARVAASDVEIEDGPPEQLVAHSATDDPARPRPPSNSRASSRTEHIPRRPCRPRQRCRSRMRARS